MCGWEHLPDLVDRAAGQHNSVSSPQLSVEPPGQLPVSSVSVPPVIKWHCMTHWSVNRSIRMDIKANYYSGRSVRYSLYHVHLRCGVLRYIVVLLFLSSLFFMHTVVNIVVLPFFPVPSIFYSYCFQSFDFMHSHGQISWSRRFMVCFFFLPAPAGAPANAVHLWRSGLVGWKAAAHLFQLTVSIIVHSSNFIILNIQGKRRHTPTNLFVNFFSHQDQLVSVISLCCLCEHHGH